MSRICRPHSSPRRTPVTTTSHRYNPKAALCARASAITLATSSGEVAGMGWRIVLGGLADSAGLRSVHSQRCAAAKAPDRMLWMPRIVLAFIGWQTCGLHPARRQSWSGPSRLRIRRGSPLGAPATVASDSGGIGPISDIRSTKRSTERALAGPKPYLNWEPVSGFEPLACRLQEVWPSARSARPARIPQTGAAMTLISPGSTTRPVHEPVHDWTERAEDGTGQA